MNIKEIFNNYYNGKKNVITPHIYGYMKKKFGEEYLLFEKSEGKGIVNEKLYCASTLVYNSKNGDTQKIELSKCFNNPNNIEEYINNITETDFNKAKRYGEIKKL